ncbi:MAG: hypothetical protein IT236_16550 [Bacteroidia bacterium]|nr:hypothetical protein [Bacteroidia bacterium]
MKKKVINTLVLVSLLFGISFQQNSLKTTQLKSSRVKSAYKKNWATLSSELKKAGIHPESFNLYIRVFKKEKVLQAWVKNQNGKDYTLLKDIAICASSGVLGPKRQQGDLQVPEGFYTIPSLHPYSNYHLALKVGYPNKSDLIKATAKDPGGDIMIHGDCVTIGCIPLQNDPVEDLYLLALESMNTKQPVKCDIFPCELNTKNFETLKKEYPEKTISFWKQLKKGYDYFELNHSLPKISVNKAGDYLVNEN